VAIYLETVLIVSGSEKGAVFFETLLRELSFRDITVLKGAGEARRLAVQRDFDLCIINAPLPDEFGDTLAVDLARKTLTQVILVVKAELYGEISARVETVGVLTVAKPLQKELFWMALKLATAAHNKMAALHDENAKLYKKIDDIKLIDRAKAILINYLQMSESEAHRYIEKRAMDERVTRREVAESIIKTYDG